MSELPHILLVEDNQDDYEATIRGLKKNHYTNPIQWCRSGQDALDYLDKKGSYASDLNSRHPDLILIDLNMPGIDGRQLLELIKSDVKFKMIPVVILSTSTDSKDIDQCYFLGANSYIQKPVNFEGLTKAIRVMLDYWFDVAYLPQHKGQG